MIKYKEDLFCTKISMFGLSIKQKEKLINKLENLNFNFLHGTYVLLNLANFLVIYKNGNINYGVEVCTFRDNSFKEIKYTEIIGTSLKSKLK